MIRSLITLCACLALTSCAAFRSEAMVEQREIVGVDRGQPTQMTETTTRKTSSEAQAGVDPMKAVNAGLALLRGDILGAIKDAKPTATPAIDLTPIAAAISASQKPGGIDAGTGTGLVAAGLLAFQQLMAKRESDRREKKAIEDALAARKDADAEYERANAAHAREVALARQLPPDGKAVQP